MRLFAAILVLAGLASAPAWAQQPAGGTGGTCSSHRSACENTCTGLRARGRCGMNCEAIFNMCMRTGEWQSPKRHITNVERR